MNTDKRGSISRIAAGSAGTGAAASESVRSGAGHRVDRAGFRLRAYPCVSVFIRGSPALLLNEPGNVVHALVGHLPHFLARAQPERVRDHRDREAGIAERALLEIAGLARRR